jgi:RNA polymerase sigma-70 factor (ECF subfamily)
VRAAEFDRRFAELFEADFPRLRRVMDRLSGEPELAADLVQEAFVRLYRRGSLPDAPAAWLISVAMNLFRNERATAARRLRLLAGRGDAAACGAPADPGESADVAAIRGRVRRALDQLPERERRMLLLQAEGYAYQDIAAALRLHEASVGTLLARARRRFRAAYEGLDAPR